MYGASVRVWNETACHRVHDATLRLLAEVGVDVRYPEGIERFRELGAQIDGARVRLGADLIEAALKTAPHSWELRSRGGDGAVELSDGPSYYGTGSDCLYTRDLRTGERRRVRLADVESMAALSERLPNIDFVMSMGLPEDAPHAIDDLAPVAAMMAGTRKPLIVAPRDGEVLDAMLEMAAACGEAASFAIYAMPSPPLMHDRDALTKLIRCAELEIPLVYAPAPSQGSTAPRSVSAAVLVGNAEVLSGLVLHQYVRPGAPFVYGAGAGAMDLRTALDPYVVPEGFLAQQLGCDLAHHYGLPSFNYAACADSKCLDGQWAAEAALTTVTGAFSGATLLHDVGYLESGLQSSHESIVFGNELAGWVRAYMREARVDEEALALDEIAAVGPGGNHLARKYTRRHGHDYWRPDAIDHNVYDRWEATGATTLEDRLRAQVAELVAAPREFTLEPAVWEKVEGILAAAAAERTT